MFDPNKDQKWKVFAETALADFYCKGEELRDFLEAEAEEKEPTVDSSEIVDFYAAYLITRFVLPKTDKITTKEEAHKLLAEIDSESLFSCWETDVFLCELSKIALPKADFTWETISSEFFYGNAQEKKS